MKSIKKKKNIKDIVILLVLLCLVFIYRLSTMKKINIYFKDLSSLIKNVLIIKNTEFSYDVYEGINKEILNENKELKKLLDIKSNNYNMDIGYVLERDYTWFNYIIVNKGKKDNILINSSVINENGLIGKIIEVGDNYSKVLLLTSNDINIAVDIESDLDYHGILDKYEKETNSLIISSVSKNSKINIGNSVYTNGLGGVFPSSIYIGRVKEINEDNLGLYKIIKVEAPNYNNIRYVGIIRR